MADNPDLVLVRRFLAAPMTPLAFDASPLAAALGTVIVDADAVVGRMVMEFAPGAGFTQGGGVLQGGIVSAMLDFVMAGAVLARIDPALMVSTASMSVSFLAAAPPATYRAEGIVERLGRSLAFTRSTLAAKDGRLIATATSVLAVRSVGGLATAAG
jgi:uncharacterized protein (TIGR00369 family)